MCRFASFTLIALAAAIAIGACGASSKPTRKTPTHSGSMLALAKCMRANGVTNFPDPAGSGGGMQIQSNGSGSNVTVNGISINAPNFQSAMSKCQREQPQGPSISAVQLATVRTGALKMASCMRSHGVPGFPDPTVSAGPGGHGVAITLGGLGSGIDPQSPAFQQAQQKCGASRGFAIRAAGSRGGASNPAKAKSGA